MLIGGGVDDVGGGAGAGCGMDGGGGGVADFTWAWMGGRVVDDVEGKWRDGLWNE